jgi:hypothetical protein
MVAQWCSTTIYGFEVAHNSIMIEVLYTIRNEFIKRIYTWY